MRNILREFKGRRVTVVKASDDGGLPVTGILADVDDDGSVLVNLVDDGHGNVGTVAVNRDGIEHVWIMPPAEPSKEPTP